MKTGKNREKCFHITGKDISWTLKVFAASALVACILSSFVYMISLVSSQPQPVNSAITATATAATAKVVVTARYTSPFISIFIFNTTAALTASFGAGIFLLIHSIFIREMEFRSRHRRYASFSIKMEKGLKPFPNVLKRIFPINRQPPITGDKGLLQPDPSIWDFCGYTKDEYRQFAHMLPHIVPTLTLIANGILVGILLSFFLFNGAVEGYGLIGTGGIALGILYNMAYFVASILPHAILELPALFLAAALGHRFACLQAGMISEQGLFLGNDIKDMKKDTKVINSITRSYIKSEYVQSFFFLLIMMLFIAAYIEINLTKHFVDHVMLTLDGVVDAIIYSR